MESLLQQQELTLGDGRTRATIYPVWDGSVLPLELIASLCNEYNSEVERGQTYPETQRLTLDAFEKYWFGGVSGVMVLGAPSAIEDFDVLEGSECLGSVHIRPCYPGRSSHICTANILVKSRHRLQGVGRTLGAVFVDWALRLGYDYALFPLVYATNVGATRILRALGFGCLATLPGAGILKGADFPVDAHCFGKRLAGAPPRAPLAVQPLPAQQRHALDFANIQYYLERGTYPACAETRIERARIRSRSRSYYVEDGVLRYKRNGAVVVIDVAEQVRVATELHRENHNGINKMQRSISERYFWSGIRETIVQVIQSCPDCRAGARAEGPRPEPEPDVVYLVPENEDDEYVPEDDEGGDLGTAAYDSEFADTGEDDELARDGQRRFSVDDGASASELDLDAYMGEQ